MSLSVQGREEGGLLYWFGPQPQSDIEKAEALLEMLRAQFSQSTPSLYRDSGVLQRVHSIRTETNLHRRYGQLHRLLHNSPYLMVVDDAVNRHQECVLPLREFVVSLTGKSAYGYLAASTIAYIKTLGKTHFAIGLVASQMEQAVDRLHCKPRLCGTACCLV